MSDRIRRILELAKKICTFPKGESSDSDPFANNCDSNEDSDYRPQTDSNSMTNNDYLFKKNGDTNIPNNIRSQQPINNVNTDATNEHQNDRDNIEVQITIVLTDISENIHITNSVNTDIAIEQQPNDSDDVDDNTPPVSTEGLWTDPKKIT